MKLTVLICLVVILMFSSFVIAQQTSKPTPTPQEAEDDVVKISTSLVQIDAVVTDKKGNLIKDLTANEVELLQDGKPQKITGFIYVKTDTPKSAQPAAGIDRRGDNIAQQSVSSRGSGIGRILTFVVDDGNCDASSGGVNAIKDGLKKFIAEQMEPNDSVAIYRTRAGSSLLQQYTSNKPQLLRIVQKIRWYPPDGICTNISGSENEPARDNSTLKSEGTFENDRDKQRREAVSDSIRDQQVTGVIGVLRYVINGLRQVGGRKVLFLMSDSLTIYNGKNKIYTNFYNNLRDITALANRSSVIINTIDDRELNAPGASAADDIRVSSDLSSVNKVDNLLAERSQTDDSRQSGLFFAADETGGRFYKNENFLENPIKQALKYEQGYYLIGYQPEDETFKGKNFHKIEIKLKRPDLTVRSRAGFFGVTDEAMRPKARTGDSELYDALAAPLPNADMNIQLSAYFASTTAKGNFIHAVMYIDGKDIAFVDEANGANKAVFDIVAVTLDDKNKIVDDFNHTNTVHIPLDKIEEIRRNGLVYTVDVPVKKNGIYTFRTALRNTATKRLGSASEIIEVPDLKKNKLFVSGLIMSSVDTNGKLALSETAESDNVFTAVISRAIPAIRQFQRNTIAGYAYTIYNVKIDPAKKQPNFSIQTKLYRDGKIFSEGKPQMAQIEAQSDMTRIRDYGYLRLNPNVPVGDYTLQIIIKDLTSGQSTNQSIDFEIIE